MGAVITPAVVTYLTYTFGWRASFALIGSAGFIWVAAWLLLVRGELRHRLAPPIRQDLDAGPLGAEPTAAGLPGGVSAAFSGTLLVAAAVAMAGFRYGFAAVQAGIAVAIVGPLLVAVIVPQMRLEGASWAAGLGEVVRNRRFWIMVAVAVTINIGWHFLVNWIPSYLKREWALDFKTGNVLSTIPFLAADAGNLLGGWASRRLAASGRSPGRARLLVMAGAMPMIMVGLTIEFAASLALALVLLSVITAGTAAFMANYFAFTQDVSRRHTGLVVGYLGALGNLAAAGGAMRDLTGSYALVFAIIGLAPIVGLAALAWGWDMGHLPDADAAASAAE
jgi:ACS family hexuronate transporter-like MFS transporter